MTIMVIRLKEITKVYQVGVEQSAALDGVNLEVGRNEYVAVMGTSGSGKSTLMNILGCLDRPTGGTYELDGRDVTRMCGGGPGRCGTNGSGLSSRLRAVAAADGAEKRRAAPDLLPRRRLVRQPRPGGKRLEIVRTERPHEAIAPTSFRRQKQASRSPAAW